MREKRTTVDFSKHELSINETDGLIIYELKIPNSYYESIKFINTNGIMAVTGDFGNWIFCREFHLSKDENCGVSDSYWCEKLSISSTQVYSKYDPELTKKKINELLSEEEDLTEEELDYLNDCLYYVDDEIGYMHHAFRNNVGRFEDYEYVPYEKEINYQLLIIFDAFDEMCKRYKLMI